MTEAATGATRKWPTADVTCSDSQITAARKVIESELGGENSVSLAFIGGSLTVGLGHAFSDLDLYVVTRDVAAVARTHDVAGLMVHVELLASAQVERLIELGSQYRITKKDRRQLVPGESVMRDLVRLTTGYRLMSSPEWNVALASLDRNVVRQVLIMQNALDFASLAEDTMGTLAIGDCYTALDSSALALRKACEAILTGCDDVYIGAKFLFRRLARTSTTAPLVSELKVLLRDPDVNADPDHVRRIAESRLLAGNHLIACAMLDGWDRPATGAVRLSLRTGDGPCRSPYYVPVRFADGTGLAGPDRSMRVTEGMLRLWRWLDGEPEEVILQNVRKCEPALDATSEESMRKAVGKLCESRVAEGRHGAC